MKIKLRGTRGSLPQAQSLTAFAEHLQDLADLAEAKGIEKVADFVGSIRDRSLCEIPHLGGNTTCTEFSKDDTYVWVDAGSGITDACKDALARGQKDFHIFQTHMHWDHIMGLPFFVPIYMPDCSLTIHHVHANAPEFIKIQFNGVNFPVKWEDLGARVHFEHHKLYHPTEVGPFQVTPFSLDHPGGSFGYHFESDGKRAAVGVDGEFKRLTAKELGKDLAIYQELDVLIFDAQYELDELASRFDWGHSSPPIGVDLALREGIKHLLLCHHDPQADRRRAQMMLDNARAYCKKELSKYQSAWQQRGHAEGPRIDSAYDGMEITL